MFLDDYTFITTNLLSGHIVAEVDLSSFNFQEILSRPGSGNATARVESESTNEDNFLSWGNALWAMKGDQIVWAGIIGSVQPRADSRVWNIPLHGFMEYYRTVPINAFGNAGLWEYSTVDGSPAPNTSVQWGIPGDIHKGGITFLDIDQFKIFKELIMHVGRRDELAQIHADVVWDELSGVIRRDTWWNYEYKMAGVAAEQLADREDGFIWGQEYYWDGNVPRFRFKLRYPTDGIQRPIVLEYSSDVEADNVVTYDLGPATRPTNSVVATGEGQGPAAIVGRVDAATTDPLGSTTGGRPRYYDVLQFTDIKIASTLTSHATKHYNRNRLPLRTARVRLQPNVEPYFLDYGLNDILRLKIDDHGTQVNELYRVTTRQVVVEKEADEIVTLDMEAAVV